MMNDKSSRPLQSTASGKLDCFEGLRGIASVAVFIGHLIIAFWPVLYSPGHPYSQNYPKFARWIANTPLRAAIDGQLAVAIFFTLSGFVLSLSFYKNGSFDSLSSAAIRRYFRLMIPASISILFAFAIMKAGWMYNQKTAQYMTQHVGFQHQWLTFFYNFDPHFRKALKECCWDTFFSNTALYNQNLWTMSVELAGSFVVYCFIALFGKLRNRIFCYMFVGTCLVFNNKLYMLNFLTGVIICDLYVMNESHRKWWLPVPLALILTYAALYINYKKKTEPYKLLFVDLERRICHEIIASFIIVSSLAFCHSLQKLFQTRVFIFLGKISFALYLLHLVLICSVASGGYLLLREYCGMRHSSAAALASLACMVSSVSLAWLMYLYVDRPAIAIGKFIYEILFKKYPISQNQVQDSKTPSAPILQKAA